MNTTSRQPGQEIHTDEHGRVRVQFPWDRDGTRDEQSSCWLRVAQGWAGAGYGIFALPRIGQEVLVAFLAGDPDQPILVGRVSNALNPLPIKLPELIGPPGAGKTVLARRMPGILPPLSLEEALDVTTVHSIPTRGVPGISKPSGVSLRGEGRTTPTGPASHE